MSRPTLTVAGQASEIVASDGGVVLNVPITLRQRSGRRVVAVGGFGCESGERTRIGATPLQLALARGHRWLRMLETGQVSSLREIAQRDGADHSYVAKHLNLTLLAPDIVAAILEDALPDGVRLSALLINPPVLWEGQRAALGVTPALPRAREAGRESGAGRASISSSRAPDPREQYFGQPHREQTEAEQRHADAETKRG
jgi:hypothetical protein